MTGLVLDAEHRYWLHGDELNGCTDTLRSVGLLNADYYTEEGMARGTAVHNRIEHCLLTGSALDNEPPFTHGGYVDAAMRYLADSKAEILNVEMPLCDPMRRIAGKPDVIAEVTPKGAEPRYAVIDWKTGQPEAWHQWQLAWYEHLARVNKLVDGIVDRIVVHLKANGTYTIRTRTAKDRDDWKVADAARLVEQAKRYL
jgi:hypothetical protein